MGFRYIVNIPLLALVFVCFVHAMPARQGVPIRAVGPSRVRVGRTRGYQENTGNTNKLHMDNMDIHSIDIDPTLRSRSQDPVTQVQAVQGLLSRLLPSHAAQVHLRLRGPQDLEANATLDTVTITGSSGNIELEGTSGVALASGLLYYLKYDCNASVSWEGNQLSLPPTLPAPRPTTRTSRVEFRLYQNVCTSSYSYAFWNLTRWYQEIDWMALNGINMPLAFTGQEYVWQETFAALGVSNEQLSSFFSGPAFLAWQRMGNVRGSWGGFGPLSSQFMLQQKNMQIAILQRMRSFGMRPILPGFAGHVPQALQSLYPQAKITRSAKWNDFPDQYCCDYLLDPMDPLYNKIGALFLQKQDALYGSDHLYSADTYNEMQPSSNDPLFLANSSRATFQAMTSYDPQAVWVMQAWLFSNTKFWQPAQIQGYLGGVPDQGMIILDLFAEVRPFWNVTNSFYGKKFIWCMLHNFGGNLGLYGTMERVWNGASAALAPDRPHIDTTPSTPASTIIGVGITMEGINQNYIMYDMALETAWQLTAPDPLSWTLQYQRRRYGAECSAARQAWTLLARSVYACQDDHENHDKSILISRPSLSLKPTNPGWYNPQDVVQAAQALLTCHATLGNTSTYLYDVVDVTRQALSDLLSAKYTDLVAAFTAQNITAVRSVGNTMLSIIADSDTLLATHPSFLLGPWIDSASSLATTAADRTQFIYNAKNQLTLWGPAGETHDYACKQWAGLTRTYYQPRWQHFIDLLTTCLQQGTGYDPSKWQQQILAWEEKWNTDPSNPGPLEPSGQDPVIIAQGLLSKYFSSPGHAS